VAWPGAAGDDLVDEVLARAHVDDLAGLERARVAPCCGPGWCGGRRWDARRAGGAEDPGDLGGWVAAVVEAVDPAHVGEFVLREQLQQLR
jgi:hypothetical protein